MTSIYQCIVAAVALLVGLSVSDTSAAPVSRHVDFRISDFEPGIPGEAPPWQYEPAYNGSFDLTLDPSVSVTGEQLDALDLCLAERPCFSARPKPDEPFDWQYTLFSYDATAGLLSIGSQQFDTLPAFTMEVLGLFTDEPDRGAFVYYLNPDSTLWYNARLDIIRGQDVPEPAALGLFGLGLIGIAVLRRARKP